MRSEELASPRARIASALEGLPAPASHPTEVQVSVVVPCYNEVGSLPEMHRQILTALGPTGRPFEVIYVDDGSRDGSADVIDEIHRADSRVEVVRLRTNGGKSSALSAGFRHARGEIICTLDADLQDDPAELPRLIEEVDSGRVDFISGWKKDRKDPWTKRFPSKFFNWFVRRLSTAKLHDFNCGLKVMRADVAESVPLHGDLYRFMPVFAAWKGYTVTESAVRHRPREHGKSKYGAARFLRGFLDFFTVLLLTRFRFRPLHLFGGGGLVLLLAGVGVMAYLSVLWFSGQPIGGRPLLLLGVLLFLTGVQGIAIGLIAEMIGHHRRRDADELGPARRLFTHRPRPKVPADRASSDEAG